MTSTYRDVIEARAKVQYTSASSYRRFRRLSHVKLTIYYKLVNLRWFQADLRIGIAKSIFRPFVLPVVCPFCAGIFGAVNVQKLPLVLHYCGVGTNSDHTLHANLMLDTRELQSRSKKDTNNQIVSSGEVLFYSDRGGQAEYRTRCSLSGGSGFCL